MSVKIACPRTEFELAGSRMCTAVQFRKEAVSEAQFLSAKCHVNMFECYEFKRQWTLPLMTFPEYEIQ